MNDETRRLTAGLDSAERAALGDLDDVVETLASDSDAPEPGPIDHARLVATLEPYLPPPTSGATQDPERERQPFAAVSRVSGAVWTQTALLQAPFWWAGLLVLLLGLGATLLNGGGLLILIFVFLTPLLSAAGVAYAFRPETRTLWELERLTPVRPLELLYARLLVVLTFDGLLSLALLTMAWLQIPQLVLWRCLVAWLGPMLALTGIALSTTVQWGPTVGAIVPLGLWGTFVLVGWGRASARAGASATSVVRAEETVAWLLSQINASTAVPVVCLLAAVLGLLLLGQAGRWVTQER